MLIGLISDKGNADLDQGSSVGVGSRNCVLRESQRADRVR